MRVPSIMYFDVKSEESTDPWWKDLVPDVSVNASVLPA
jgi:hypothetical protein